MTVTRPCYCTREQVKRAADIKLTARNDWQIDIAMAAAADGIEGLTHRQFYPEIGTRYFDWPNFQGTYPWKIYLDAAELADITDPVPTVTTGGNNPQTITAADVLFGPWNYAPPYSRMELDRSTSAAFGLGNTPQRDTRITGVFGYWIKTTPAGTLAAALTDTTGTAVQVSNGAAVGVGDNILVDSERMLVTDRSVVTTGQTQQGTGVSTASNADNILAVTDGTKFSPQEEVLLDAERMFITDVAGNNLAVIRAWNGTVLAAHSGATVYADRLLTVQRGALGTTAATHSLGVEVNVAVVPGLVNQLAIAESLVDVAQQMGAYTTVQGEGATGVTKIGQGLPDLRQRVYVQFGRQARQRVV